MAITSVWLEAGSSASPLPQVDGCFQSPSWLRFIRVNDGVSKAFPLFVGHLVTYGASIVLLEMSPIVEMPDS
jgi:hypothetical protein